MCLKLAEPFLECHMEKHLVCLEISKLHAIVESKRHFFDLSDRSSHLQRRSNLLARFHTLYEVHHFTKYLIIQRKCSILSYLESEISLAMCISGFQIESSSTKRIPLSFNRSSHQLSIDLKSETNNQRVQNIEMT